MKNLKNEIIKQMANLITAAFGLVAALAWNGAVKAIFEKAFGTAEGIGPMLTYAIVVTIVAVLAVMWISRLAVKAEGDKKEEKDK